MKKQTCEHCVYAGHVRNGQAGELICANCQVAPGELVRVESDGTCPNFRGKLQPSWRPPPLPPTGNICYIPLTKGQYAMVDAADYPELSKYKWTALVTSNNVYAVRGGRKGEPRTVYMHRQIMQPPAGMVTDHVDHNGRNNCRCNLRNCTRLENLWNSRGCGSASGFKNIYFDEKMRQYFVRISHAGRPLHFGWFDDPVAAARFRDLKALDLYGPRAFLTRPQDLEPRPVPPDPNHPERRAGIAGPFGYLRCAPYAPLSPPGPGLLDLRAGGVNRIVRIAAGTLEQDQGIARMTGHG
jgi:hypothetical protein